MKSPEFDKFADEYQALHAASITASGEAPRYFADYKIRDLAEEWRRAGGASQARVMDFGAGSGNSIAPLAQHMPQACVICVDVSQRSLTLARSLHGDRAQYVRFDGGLLPFDDGAFDIVFAACVFHHIDHGEHVGLLQEWRRVLRPGGLAMIYEHNPFNPLTRRVVSNCVFDENAHLITAGNLRNELERAGFAAPWVRHRVFFPHALRAFRPLESRLTGVPLGAQYYVAARR